MTVNQALRWARETTSNGFARISTKIGYPVIVLLYHRVATLDHDLFQMAVSPERFREQMAYIAGNYRVLRFEAEWKPERGPAVVITFDDGYVDNYRTALPILEELGLPATFFVTTGHVGAAREFWWDELERVFLTTDWLPRRLDIMLGGQRIAAPTDTLLERKNAALQVHALLLKMMPTDRDAAVEAVVSWSGARRSLRDGYRSMTVEELRALGNSPGATIGAHTVSHTALSVLPLDQQRAEILGSKRQLEEWLGREIATFSYPYGRRRDFTRATASLCNELGFRRAAAGWAAPVHKWTKPFNIPRYYVGDWTLDEFCHQLRIPLGLKAIGSKRRLATASHAGHSID